MEDPNDSSDEELEQVARIITLTSGYYCGRHICKDPCRTSVLTGAAWVTELEEGNSTRIFENLRMPKRVFHDLCAIVENAAPLSPWAMVQTNERVAIFPYCLSRNASNRELQERFQHSGETVHRQFHAALDVICSLAPRYLVQPKSPFTVFAQNPKFADQFSNCRLAFDGTHIPAFVRDEDAKPYRDRTGGLSQNVFAACTFDMYFASVLAGWEGSAANSTVLADARRKGFITPPGLFDLGDAGYRLCNGVTRVYTWCVPHMGTEYPKS
ncbi:hypothetical protein F441_11938 [Phytophthora nicotianae CJ01A1]|uniref:DUF8040 domain-containing protein n=1 Tax=Phytophthora nicotianae CJ01A1 TaxID=1317063 RepID=W2WT55_PHYNI|nr:hypothetical protein F441_11938 [Phytophthora nicotianae CJ01A1]